MTVNESLRRYLGKARRFFQRLKPSWWDEPIKPIYDHNQKKIVSSDTLDIMEILFRVKVIQGQKLVKIGNSIGTTIDPDIISHFKETSTCAQTFCGIIESAKIYDKDGLHIKETVISEPAILTTRLLNKELEK